MINKQVRDALRSVLIGIEVDGTPLFDEDSVYAHRHTIGSDESETLPAACIYVESGEVETKRSIEEDDVDFVVEIYDKAVLSIDDRLDELMGIIRPVIKANRMLNGLVDYSKLTAYKYESDESNTIGVLTLNLVATIEQ
ncbi:hypothetical protein L1077_21580 [Pseudoalteromonas luteoviolacea]|uniref:hypothetical protein n=1 Tax=Pseudoalteromonas luteoviolacea TaxID=43657 RepID=UPI001F2DCF46|nr:hypothetical protein [Pseudoalteromonas luteoviolacea]MCF6442025.1 hypothetical protein [Pseudoalteromonas luteoviolacea]